MNEGLTTLKRAMGGDIREFALLWLVFSLLDVLVKDELTVRWLIGNMLFCTVLWTLGAYIELSRSREN